MANLDPTRMRRTILAVAPEFIEQARELQRVARVHVIPLVSDLQAYGAEGSSPRIRSSELKQGYLNLLFVQLHHLVEQQISVMLGSKNESRKFDFSRDELMDELYLASRIDVTMLSSWTDIEELRLISNTVKHSDARDSWKLKQLRPEFFTDPRLPFFDRIRLDGPSVMPIIGMHFRPPVSEYDSKVNSVGAFWKEMSECARGAKMLPTVRDKLAARRDDVIQIAAKHGASNVRIFGSVARGDAGPTSDIDLLVDFASGTSFGEELRLVEELEELLGRKVDLGSPDALKSGKKERILSEAIPL